MKIGISISITSRLEPSFFPASLFAAGEPGVWFDPSDISTLFQDSAGTTPVTAAGQPVGIMLDKSGRGNNATQTIAGSRPIYQIDVSGRPYLLFDGIDDIIVTPTITPGLDKVQTFMGITKISDATGQMGFEFSPSISVNAGSFRLGAPVVSGNASYGFASRGSASIVNAISTNTFPAPITNVVTGLSDIAGSFVEIRINSSFVLRNSNTQGTGNFLSYPLYIGQRAGGLLPILGRVYGLVVRFGQNMIAGQITDMESWMNAKTGAY